MSPAAIFGAALAVAAPAQTAAPQQPGPTPRSRSQATPESPPSDDVVVTGLRDIDEKTSAVTTRTTTSGRTGRGSVFSRQAFNLAERFARCAVKREIRGRAELRGALDGTIGSARQVFQQGRFVQLNASCAADVDRARSGVSADTPGYNQFYYDRGALFLQALRVFAPGLKLTKAQTADPDVQRRFNLRETALARFRLPVDRTYFETAVCLVRLQPELSVRLLNVARYQDVTTNEAAIVNGARICTGNARRVYFDPVQFRFYIADAVYRWALAAQNKATFIPDAG